MVTILEPLQYEFFVRALAAAVVVGTICAVVGTYVVLKGLAFIGDAISHAAFPGVVAAFVLGGSYYRGGHRRRGDRARHHLRQPAGPAAHRLRPSASCSPARSRWASSC